MSKVILTSLILLAHRLRNYRRDVISNILRCRKMTAAATRRILPPDTRIRERRTMGRSPWFTRWECTARAASTRSSDPSSASQVVSASPQASSDVLRSMHQRRLILLLPDCDSGVQEVNTELESSKLTVVGKMDPWKLRDRVEAKTQKKVDLVSPIKKPDAAADQKPVGDKAKEVCVVFYANNLSVYYVPFRRLPTSLDADRGVLPLGVHDVSIDAQNELVTVTGTMDAKAVTKISSHNMVREVKAVVQPKKDDGGGKKKKGGGGEGGSEGANEEHAATPAAVAEASRMEWYYHRMHHAPQLFSDENPNACSIS
ncbi:hypothetical protein BHE74_00052564 [Ensete ventricosum]|nr:hypothetical protein GW17_00011068 [Ensete ventricosum]RWW41919.1 hypothetical protein BHE74_00052564 [Ensete ventricosum]RZR78743.1 hypothetical protein BHM03_00004213 [Ensete ventricosum]